ncbi:phage holin family protein [Deferribacter autotrophicus]|uniref:Phage holin family protein n=1 Tax=Deferribacter autotrophicus TaxID=500465 RepID=A0A5A8F3B7_9BACT|nr:phage holin family protein [Deferribacter autotrophicus]KAA0258021.1 phage holin family protein [Deferribacter autotrophicus]
MYRPSFIVYRICVNIVAIGFAAIIFKHIVINSFLSLIIAGVLLTILNIILKPIILIVTLPIQILSFGFFYLITNAFILKLTSVIIGGFFIDGFWPAVGGSIIIGIVNFVFDIFVTNSEIRFFEWK